MSSDLEVYQAKGLTAEEAGLVQAWEIRGRPGVSRLKAEVFQKLYLMGYSCQEISSQFPEYELGLLLWARYKYNWDQDKAAYQATLANQAKAALQLSKAEQVRFLFDVMAATHLKYRQEILRYMAAPDREPAPDFLPKTLHGYAQLVALMQELMEVQPLPGTGQTNPTGSPLVSVTVNQPSGEKPASIEVKPLDVKEALLERMGKKSG